MTTRSHQATIEKFLLRLLKAMHASVSVHGGTSLTYAHNQGYIIHFGPAKADLVRSVMEDLGPGEWVDQDTFSTTDASLAMSLLDVVREYPKKGNGKNVPPREI